MEPAETEHRPMEALQLNNGVFTDVDVQMDKQKRVVQINS